MYILSTGCQWRYIPKDLPPRSTVYRLFRLWKWDGTLDRIHHALYVKCREQAEREASPTACDHRQPEREERRKRGACIDPHGYDAGKKIKGKKRHILVDTQGLLLHAIVHAADIQDRDGGVAAAGDAVRAVSLPAKSSSPTAAIKGRSFSDALAANSAAASKPRSSSDPIRRRASWSCPSDGWSSEPSPG